jgi:hypothetical protein
MERGQDEDPQNDCQQDARYQYFDSGKQILKEGFPRAFKLHQS